MAAKRLNREDFVLACLASADRVDFKPVHVQKFFFLIDRRLSDAIGGEYFAFTPYDYGPFDQNVYQELDCLSAKGLLEVQHGAPWEPRTYHLTEEGVTAGKELLNEIPEEAREPISRLSIFIRGLSFRDLISAIYRAYPEMKVNSVFKGAQ